MRKNLKALMRMPALPMFEKGKYLNSIESPIYQWLIKQPEIADMILAMVNESGMIEKDEEGLFNPKFSTMKEFQDHKKRINELSKKERINQKRIESVKNLHDRIKIKWPTFPNDGILVSKFALSMQESIPTVKRWVEWSDEYSCKQMPIDGKKSGSKLRVVKNGSESSDTQSTLIKHKSKVLELAFQAVSFANNGKVLEFELAKEFAVKWAAHRQGISIQDAETKIAGYSKNIIIGMLDLKNQDRFVYSGEGSRVIDSQVVKDQELEDF